MGLRRYTSSHPRVSGGRSGIAFFFGKTIARTMAGNEPTTWDIAICRANLQARWQREDQAREQRRLAAIAAVRVATDSILPRFPQVKRVYLFGSVLRTGALRATSDIDIAVEGNLSAEDYFALWRELEHRVTHWPIELVELDRDVRFAASVRERGMVIYERTDSDIEGGDPG